MEAGTQFELHLNDVQPTASGDVRLVMLHHTDAESWRLMPQALLRLAAFIQRYDADADPAWLQANLRYNFVVDDPRVICIVAVAPTGLVVGHLYAEVANWGGKDVILIVQYELDHALPPTVIAQGFDMLEAWGAAVNPDITFFQALASHQGTIRAFRRYGFHTKYAVLRRDMGE